MEILKNNFYCHSNFSERNFVLYFFQFLFLYIQACIAVKETNVL